MHHRRLIVLMGLALAFSLGGSAANADKVYWVDQPSFFGGGAIRRANLDGSNVEDLQTGLGFPMGIALDVAAGKMYVAESGAGVSLSEVRRSNLDGSNMETLFQGLGGDFFYGIALDNAGGKVYVSDNGGGRIFRANLVDGSNVEVLVSGLPTGVKAIALDLVGGKMYWASPPGKITRANLDGSSVEDVFTGGTITEGVAIDPIAGKVYWTDFDNFATSAAIMRANLDGTSVETLIAFGPISLKEICLDIQAGKMYWASDADSQAPGRIRRANLDGSNIEDIVTGANLSPYGIALELSQPADIPTVSEWGLVAMALLMLTAGTIVYMRRRTAVVGCTD